MSQSLVSPSIGWNNLLKLMKDQMLRAGVGVHPEQFRKPLNDFLDSYGCYNTRSTYAAFDFSSVKLFKKIFKESITPEQMTDIGVLMSDFCSPTGEANFFQRFEILIDDRNPIIGSFEHATSKSEVGAKTAHIVSLALEHAALCFASDPFTDINDNIITVALLLSLISYAYLKVQKCLPTMKTVQGACKIGCQVAVFHTESKTPLMPSIKPFVSRREPPMQDSCRLMPHGHTPTRLKAISHCLQPIPCSIPMKEKTFVNERSLKQYIDFCIQNTLDGRFQRTIASLLQKIIHTSNPGVLRLQLGTALDVGVRTSDASVADEILLDVTDMMAEQEGLLLVECLQKLVERFMRIWKKNQESSAMQCKLSLTQFCSADRSSLHEALRLLI